MPPNQFPQSNETRLQLLEEHKDRAERTLESVAESLKVLTRLSVQSDAIEKLINDIDTRVERMEADWPVMTLIKAGALWVVRIVLAGAFVAVLTVAGVKVGT